MEKEMFHVWSDLKRSICCVENPGGICCAERDTFLLRVLSMQIPTHMFWETSQKTKNLSSLEFLIFNAKTTKVTHLKKRKNLIFCKPVSVNQCPRKRYHIDLVDALVWKQTITYPPK